jgi:hypothetical protein
LPPVNDDPQRRPADRARNGRDEERGLANPPTSAIKTPICSELFAQLAASARRSPCPIPTRRRQLHLDEISRYVAEGAHAVVLLDRAGWHTTRNLTVPQNITPILLPSRASELNPVENVGSTSARTGSPIASYDAIIDAACEAWMKLMAMPETITSIGMREWAHVGREP